MFKYYRQAHNVGPPNTAEMNEKVAKTKIAKKSAGTMAAEEPTTW